MVYLRILTLTFLLVLPLSAGARLQITSYTFTAQEDGWLEADTNTLHRPLVFELGKQKLPWRQINDVILSGNKAKWAAQKDREYLVTTANQYALTQLNAVRADLGHGNQPTKDIPGDLVRALRWVQQQRKAADNDQLQMAESRLSSALSALLGITVEIKAGVDQKVWPEYHIPLKLTVQCREKSIRLRQAGLTMPDNWKLTRMPENQWRRLAPGEDFSISANVRIPGQSVYYAGSYPVIAWYEVEYSGVRFRTSNATELNLIHPIDKQATITTVSDTQIDLNVRVTSLLPINDIKTELYLPEGWTGEIPEETFDLNCAKDITYRITRPPNEPPGLRIVGAIFRIEDYATSKRLITDHALELGERTAVTGLRLAQSPDDEAPVTTIAGRTCRQHPPSGAMGVDVSDNFSPGERTFLTVECAGTGNVRIEYRTSGGSRVSTISRALNIQDGWKELVFVLENARFDGSFSGGADFRICLGGGPIGVSGIRVSRFNIR